MRYSFDSRLTLACVVSTLVSSLAAEPATKPGAALPAITKPVMFNTPEADAIVATLQIFPPDNPWNSDITYWPVHKNSAAIVASVGLDKPLRYNPDMAFIIVPPDQPKVPIDIVGYPGESDPGPFPLPDNLPVEGWPISHRSTFGFQLQLEDVQRDKAQRGGDRHAIVLDPTAGLLYELFGAKLTDLGWQADAAAIFNLRSNKLRTAGWTSADAAGLPIFPAVIRYEELKAGQINHALRVTIRNTQKAYVHPATHFASNKTDPNLPRMGERFRLREDVNISKFSPEVRTILTALKKHGMFVADNGIEWAISCAPDQRIRNLHSELRRIKGADFEVVESPFVQ